MGRFFCDLFLFSTCHTKRTFNTFERECKIFLMYKLEWEIRGWDTLVKIKRIIPYILNQSRLLHAQNIL